MNVLNAPGISGTAQDFEDGKAIYTLYCAQCHGDSGQGDGPASDLTYGGYIMPEPANFTESGGDFPNYGRWVWKVKEGVETTNMPPWKWALTDEEVYQVIFYEQSFSTPDDYNAKWAPLYSDSFGRNLMGTPVTSSITSGPIATSILAAMLLWNLHHRNLLNLSEQTKLKKTKYWTAVRRRFH
jgi:mono/diheme cytochrome c family protein